MQKKNRYGLTLAFWIALIGVLAIVVLSLIFPNAFERLTASIRASISVNFGWFYLLSTLGLIFVCVFLMLSPAGKIRLGDPHTAPEYSTISWISMLFSAGMGITLVFYGASEPLSHYAIQAPEAAEYTQEALRDAFKYTFLHYGIHGWAIYAIVGLALAYFQFRKKEPALFSSTLKPLFGRKMDGSLGKIVDSLTIFATITGVATSLGAGSMQINGGLNFLVGTPQNFKIQLIIIIIATVLFMTSAVSGLDKGVKLLSNGNMIMAILLMIGAVIIGPSVRMFDILSESIGAYMQDFLRISTQTGVGNPAQQKWVGDWTILFLTWWLAWSPFVGLFIARISRGRTVREFVGYVLLVPTLFSILWFTIFGVLSINALDTNPNLIEYPLESLLFGTFEQYPMTTVMSIIAIFLVFSFFITSADSATFVLSMQSENGTLHPQNWIKILWGLILALIAAVLLRFGGINTLQNVMIIVAFPFAILLIIITVSLLKELHYERGKMGLTLDPKRYPEKDSPFRSYEDTDEDDDEV